MLHDLGNMDNVREIPLIVAKGPELEIVSVNYSLSDLLLWEDDTQVLLPSRE